MDKNDKGGTYSIKISYSGYPERWQAEEELWAIVHDSRVETGGFEFEGKHYDKVKVTLTDDLDQSVTTLILDHSANGKLDDEYDEERDWTASDWDYSDC